MTKVEDLMRLVDSLADAAFATGQAQSGIRPACVLPDTKHLRRRIEHALIPLCTEIEVLRDAVEGAYAFITAMSSDPDCDDDGTQGALRATRRQMAEALGNALPRLLYEKQGGQKLFGLRYRELAGANAHLRDAIIRAEESLRQPVNGPGTAVDSRSAARTSSSAFHSQPSGIVHRGWIVMGLPAGSTKAAMEEAMKVGKHWDEQRWANTVKVRQLRRPYSSLGAAQAFKDFAIREGYELVRVVEQRKGEHAPGGLTSEP